MKVTKENIEELPVNIHDKKLLKALLKDLEEITKINLYIDFINEHTEYSPERTDPCPDYYGMYRILLEDNPSESIGVEMTIDELDLTICALVNFSEYIKNEEVES